MQIILQEAVPKVVIQDYFGIQQNQNVLPLVQTQRSPVLCLENVQIIVQIRQEHSLSW